MTRRRARIVVPGEMSAVTFARKRVLAYVTGWGVPMAADEREAVKLVASELITNAVVHSDGLVVVGLYYHLGEGRLLLVVHDHCPEPPCRQHAADDDEGGRGLALVDSVAARNGWEPTRRGKRVWAEFDVPVCVPNPGDRALLRSRLQAIASHQHVRHPQSPLVKAAVL
ncbi:anti-sigma regulatory factor (Ser/Thr protein kinase) [Streptomyces sp. V4I23]|uniref:ATP-binding protein n=1 Tax=Streptomyces sp. V4I23 TaxID=3042282 RepID=UPI00278121AA|nr:ATP-binding protein [Streptomyces sp. V4I23]MDQ1010142.1 anti-sigma regulatory factor (Ser/Thr protein kinase) [Streptomyces sp. V4I23]